MAKFAWTWLIKPEYLDEYVQLHRAVWPEVLKAHKDAGFRNYSIFQDGNRFFYVFECDDVSATNAYIAANSDCQRWNTITSKMVVGSFDWGDTKSTMYLDEIFYLE